jgi:chromosome segregation ATPase
MEARTRENLRQHEDNSKHLTAALEAGNERLQSMLTALHEMETRMTTATVREIAKLHERINPLGEMAAGHKSEIKGLNDRIQHLWEMIQALWSHVFAKPAPRK